MIILKERKNYTLPIISAIFFLLYLVFLTNNSSIDSWGYAAYISQGENLFLSHHLFYNAHGFLWVKLIGLAFSIDTLKLLIVVNALFAAATLYILGKTLQLLRVEAKKVVVWVAFAGGSWAIMRFATENENYIIPIFFSMLGSYFFFRSMKDNRMLMFFYSGLFASIACLFHQVMFFWWLSLLIGIAFNRKSKPIIWYAAPAIIVPLAYILVLVFYYSQPLSLDALMRFVFRDYYSGAAGVSTGLGGFIFFFISLFRTFFQVHGYIANLFHFSLLFYFGGLAAAILLLFSFIKLWKTRWNWVNVKEQVVWVHLLAITLQLLFALLSSGNTEFMVMIPMLLAIVLSQIAENEYRFIGLLATGMLVWNLSFGLIPLRFYELDNTNTLAAKVLAAQKENKPQLYILFNKPRVENEVKYNVGDYPKNIISGIQRDSLCTITSRIDDALAKNIPVLTDCINRPHTISRESLVVSNDYANLFAGYKYQKVDSVQTLTGKYFLYLISRK